MTDKMLIDMGKRIAKQRKFLGLTQEFLAEKLDVSVQMISNLECGRKALRLKNLVKLSSELDISIDYILTGKRSQNENYDLLNKLNKLNSHDYEIVRLLIEHCSLSE